MIAHIAPIKFGTIARLNQKNKKYNLFFWLSLAMVPNLIGAMCAITWHIYDNQENLYGLVSLQGIFTLIGNSTLALAAIKIFRGKETYE